MGNLKLGGLNDSNEQEIINEFVDSRVQTQTLYSLPDSTLSDKELSSEDLLKVRKQWSLYQNLKHINVVNPLQIRIQMKLPEVLPGMLIHGTKYSREKILNLKTTGVLSGELIGILEDNETNFCADFYKTNMVGSVKDYVDWYHVPDTKFRPDGTVFMKRSKIERSFLPGKFGKSDQIALLIDPSVADLQELLKMDAYSDYGQQQMAGIINGLPHEPSSSEGARLSAILCGIPGNFVSALILSSTVAQNKEEVAYIRSVWGPNVVLFDVEGQIL